MMSQFSYLIDKIEAASFDEEPFRHIEINEFLSPEHFAAITRDPQIALPRARDARELLSLIDRAGYKIIPFPGCVTDGNAYLRWLEHGSGKKIHGATEGFGIVYRLVDSHSSIIDAFNRFLVSDPFQQALTRKFGIEAPVDIDTGIQKYLHGYEISPHPDIRRKALTWMLNINPGEGSETLDFHTHYMRLKPEWSFISSFWKGNPDVERDWLPWSWCETVKRQPRNNSIVIFAPSDETIHAVKANYDHLGTQRTQMYGNLWYPAKRLAKVDYTRFAITGSAVRRHEHVMARERAVASLKATAVGRSVLSLRDRLTRRHVDRVRRVDV